MNNIVFTTNKENLNSEELVSFWVSVGWGNKNDYVFENVAKAIENTSYIVAAKDDKGFLVGLARVFSDGFIHTNLAEIAVLPEYRKKGVGKKMIDMIIKNFKETGIFLEAFEENRDFFEKCGFVKRNNMLVYSRRFSKKNI